MGLLAPHYYPIALAILSSLTFIVTAIVALCTGHTNIDDWPYVSENASRPPESCIFALFISTCALIIAVIVYVRYKQVKAFYRVHWVSHTINRINRVALYVGWTCAVAFSVTACFPVAQEPTVHYTAAYVGFGSGILYFVLQIVSSYKLNGTSHGKKTIWLRWFFIALATYALLVAIIFGKVATMDEKDMPWHWSTSIKNVRKFSHIISSIHVWILILTFDLYFLTFVPEFKRVTIDYPNIVLSYDGGIYESLEEEREDLEEPEETA